MFKSEAYRFSSHYFELPQDKYFCKIEIHLWKKIWKLFILLFFKTSLSLVNKTRMCVCVGEID